jgi:hypothetical protein
MSYVRHSRTPLDAIITCSVAAPPLDAIITCSVAAVRATRSSHVQWRRFARRDHHLFRGGGPRDAIANRGFPIASSGVRLRRTELIAGGFGNPPRVPI